MTEILRPYSTGFKPLLPSEGFPKWLKLRLKANNGEILETHDKLRKSGLLTICEEAACPNQATCWEHSHAAVMILGRTCTRHCRFCNVNDILHIEAPDKDEPIRLAKAVQAAKITHLCVTSVTRDDLPDGGATHWAETISAIHQLAPNVTIEVLVPDFLGDKKSIDIVLESNPDIFGHNIETIPRLYKTVRPEADYQRSLALLEYASSKGFRTKSSMMLGLGETDDEILETMLDLRKSNVNILYLGQYLRPTKSHIEVSAYLHPDHFAKLGDIAKTLGFEEVASAPLIRSSYRKF